MKLQTNVKQKIWGNCKHKTNIYQLYLPFG